MTYLTCCLSLYQFTWVEMLFYSYFPASCCSLISCVHIPDLSLNDFPYLLKEGTVLMLKLHCNVKVCDSIVWVWLYSLSMPVLFLVWHRVMTRYLWCSQSVTFRPDKNSFWGIPPHPFFFVDDLAKKFCWNMEVSGSCIVLKYCKYMSTYLSIT